MRDILSHTGTIRIMYHTVGIMSYSDKRKYGKQVSYTTKKN